MAGLLDKRLLLVSGKGGVGKSTVAAALALSFARRKLRTLICEVNAQERIPGLLGHPPVGAQLSQIEPMLWAVNVEPSEAMREYALMIIRFKSVYRAVFENRVISHFLRMIPSLAELVMLGKILFHLQQKNEDGTPRFDRVVVDAPATGHAIAFFNVPHVILDTVPPGPMSKEAQVMKDLLESKATTAAVLVSLPEEMPLNETVELNTALREKVGIAPYAAVLNAFTGPRFNEQDLSALSPHSRLWELAESHRIRSEQSQKALERLKADLGLPVQTVPRLFHNAFGRAAIEEVATHLNPLLEAP